MLENEKDVEEEIYEELKQVTDEMDYEEVKRKPIIEGRGKLKTFQVRRKRKVFLKC